MKVENFDPFDLSLRIKGHSSEEKIFISEQVQCRKKAKLKLPVFYANGCIYTKRALEQSTHEVIAKYKSSILKGNILIDLCAGLGVDDYFLSPNFNNVISVDNDLELNQIVEFNFKKLGVNNIKRATGKAEDYDFTNLSSDDIVYLDPDRRGNDGTRQYDIQEHSPNISEIITKVNNQCDMYFKLSPMTDIQSIVNYIDNIKCIYIVSYKFENKEILVYRKSNYSGNIEIKSIELGAQIKMHSSLWGEKVLVDFNWDRKLISIPSPSVIKGNNYNSLAVKYGLTKINKEGHILFSDQYIPEFPGRQFSIIQSSEYKPKVLKAYLNDNGILKSNIISRNFFHKPHEIMKKFKLIEGGDDYLIFTNDYSGKPMIFHCKKITY